MNRLREIARDIARQPPPSLLPSERLFVTERAAATLESQRMSATTRATPDPDAIEAIDTSALRRLLDTMWWDPRWNGPAAGLVTRARSIGTPSLDRAIILAYLRHYPAGHGAFDALRAAAAAASVAHDWPWAARGQRWALWTPDGPDVVHDAITGGRIEDQGLLRILATSAFLAARG